MCRVLTDRRHSWTIKLSEIETDQSWFNLLIYCVYTDESCSYYGNKSQHENI